MSNGRKANRKGTRQEFFIIEELEDLRYVEGTPENFFNLRCLKQPIFAWQCYAGHSIYDTRRKVDVILYHPEKWADTLVIQSKWQARSGSIHEKFPYEVFSIEHNEFPTLIVLDGGGYSKRSEEWLKSQVENSNKLIGVFNQGEFQRFASQNL